MQTRESILLGKGLIGALSKVGDVTFADTEKAKWVRVKEPGERKAPRKREDPTRKIYSVEEISSRLEEAGVRHLGQPIYTKGKPYHLHKDTPRFKQPLKDVVAFNSAYRKLTPKGNVTGVVYGVSKWRLYGAKRPPRGEWPGKSPGWVKYNRIATGKEFAAIAQESRAAVLKRIDRTAYHAFQVFAASLRDEARIAAKKAEAAEAAARKGGMPMEIEKQAVPRQMTDAEKMDMLREDLARLAEPVEVDEGEDPIVRDPEEVKRLQGMLVSAMINSGFISEEQGSALLQEFLEA